MNPSVSVALAVVVGTMVGAVVYGQRKSRGENIEEWAVGGRRFGMVIFWFLNAGEIYTTFAVLGISGFAWSFGAPAFMSLCSVSLSAIVGYWLTPKIWAAGFRGKFITQADFFLDAYGSRLLAVAVGLAGIAALVVYVQIQITALSLIVRLALDADISPLTAAIVSAVLMLTFVFVAGLRSAAFAAGVKDILMLAFVVGIGVTIAHKVGATSILDIFHRVQAENPGIGKFPGLKPEEHLTTVWLITASINVALGTWVFPHMFQLCYAASNADTIRRNAIWQPLYSLSYFFIILLGFAALVAHVQPPGGDLNGAALQLVADRYPAWVSGLFAGVACLLALVPGSVLLLTCGTIFSRNVVRAARPDLSDRASLMISRGSMVLFAAIAVYLTVGGNRSLVAIGLSAYASIGMLAPGVFLVFLKRQPSPSALLGGMMAGYAVLLVPAAGEFWHAHAPEWDVGLIALIINVAVVGLLSLALRITPRRAAIA
jgi:SSS family solute:Na+ symporter